MELGSIIEWRYPNAEALRDYEVRDDSSASGPYISFWDEAALGPQPTPEQLASWEIPAVKQRKKWELAWAADEQYRLEIPSFAGVVVAAKYGRSGLTGLTAPERAIFDKINAGYAKFNTLVAEVDAATTVEQVKAIRW